MESISVIIVVDLLPTVLLLVLGTISSVFLFFKKRYCYWKNRGEPFVEPTFPFGVLPPRKVIHFQDVTGKIHNQKSGSPFIEGSFFASPIVVATDLDFVQYVLIKDFTTFHKRGMYNNEAEDLLSAHVFSLDGEKWKSLRAKLSPTFTSGKMKFIFSTVAEVADRFNETLTKLVRPSAVLEMKDLCARSSLVHLGSNATNFVLNFVVTVRKFLEIFLILLFYFGSPPVQIGQEGSM